MVDRLQGAGQSPISNTGDYHIERTDECGWSTRHCSRMLQSQG